jgi:uncharacterized Zn-finger protein
VAEPPEPRVVRDDEATCRGSASAPHPPRHLPLPPEGTVICPDCGARFRRAPLWARLVAAHWPKSR